MGISNPSTKMRGGGGIPAGRDEKGSGNLKSSWLSSPGLSLLQGELQPVPCVEEEEVVWVTRNHETGTRVGSSRVTGLGRSLPYVEGSRGQEELRYEACSGKIARGLCNLGQPFCHLMPTHISCTNNSQLPLQLGILLLLLLPLLLLLNSPVVHWAPVSV